MPPWHMCHASMTHVSCHHDFLNSSAVPKDRQNMIGDFLFSLYIYVMTTKKNVNMSQEMWLLASQHMTANTSKNNFKLGRLSLIFKSSNDELIIVCIISVLARLRWKFFLPQSNLLSEINV